jgi:hypothetical protein
LAVETPVEVSPGTITKFYRLFPPGCAGLVGLQVFWQTRQIFPTTPGAYYLGDGSEVLGDASVELDEPEYILMLRGWSPGTTYDHIVYCEFYIAKPISLPVLSVEKVRVLVPGME